MQGCRDTGARLGQRASWKGRVLQEDNKLWSPQQACHGVLSGEGWPRDMWLAYEPERACAARIQLEALETGCSREAPPALGDCREEQTAATRRQRRAALGSLSWCRVEPPSLACAAGMVWVVWPSESPPDSGGHSGCARQSCAGWYAGHREEGVSASEQRSVRDTGHGHSRQACAPTPARIALQGRVAYAHRPHVRIPHGRARAP
jgi:hypothetical protein